MDKVDGQTLLLGDAVEELRTEVLRVFSTLFEV